MGFLFSPLSSLCLCLNLSSLYIRAFFSLQRGLYRGGEQILTRVRLRMLLWILICVAVIRTVDSVHYCFDGIFDETGFAEMIVWPLDCNV